MNGFPVLFSHDEADPISQMVAFAQHGTPSHVAFISPCGTLVREASGSKRKGYKTGVREVSIDVWKQWHQSHELRWIPHEHLTHDSVWAEAEKYIGWRYDWGGIWAYVFRMLWLEHPGRVNCSEYVFTVAIALGHPLFSLPDHKNTSTPRDLRNISQPMEQ